MAIHVYCPYCHQCLEALSQDCHHCGAGLPVGVLSALAMAFGGTPAPAAAPHGVPAHIAQAVLATVTAPPGTPLRHSAWRPWLAATLSCCCGLGQLYNGQIRKGLILLVVAGIAVLTWGSPVSKVLTPFVWLYAMVDAYLVARRHVYR